MIPPPQRSVARMRLDNDMAGLSGALREADRGTARAQHRPAAAGTARRHDENAQDGRRVKGVSAGVSYRSYRSINGAERNAAQAQTLLAPGREGTRAGGWTARALRGCSRHYGDAGPHQPNEKQQPAAASRSARSHRRRSGMFSAGKGRRSRPPPARPVGRATASRGRPRHRAARSMSCRPGAERPSAVRRAVRERHCRTR
jgi:hypothetical protein